MKKIVQCSQTVKLIIVPFSKDQHGYLELLCVFRTLLPKVNLSNKDILRS